MVEPGKIDAILDTVEDVRDYFEFKAVIDLGCNIHHSELSFEKTMVYSWIKRELENG